ncbi:hypothetical protein [Hazenella coriacea]|uniref:Uncharacterized protein n=1 Tax=Hazenella coriacea TaxID=1179467 RepID=A0A4R3L7E2_9BACL|nr:hypothetical protein [Hazenella coriacea]TCS95018.1 hypothetical protein EDD58_103443 [Hazenella coriacea]
MSKKGRKSSKKYLPSPLVCSYVHPYAYPYINGYSGTGSYWGYPRMVVPTYPQFLWSRSSYPMMRHAPINPPSFPTPHSSFNNISPKQSSYQKKESEWKRQWDSPESPQSPWIRAYENHKEEM